MTDFKEIIQELVKPDEERCFLCTMQKNYTHICKKCMSLPLFERIRLLQKIERGNKDKYHNKYTKYRNRYKK